MWPGTMPALTRMMKSKPCSGPRQVVFKCTQANRLSAANLTTPGTEPLCNIPTQVDFVYRATDGSFKPYTREKAFWMAGSSGLALAGSRFSGPPGPTCQRCPTPEDPQQQQQ